MKTLSKFSAVVSVMLLTTAALAQPTPQEQAERAVELRQSILKLVASNFGPLRAMGRGDIPVNAELAGKAATRISQLSLMMTDYFAYDTREFDVETEALPVIWEQPDAFAEKVMNLTNAADAVVAAVQSGDAEDIRNAAGSVGRNCRGCHDDFRLDN